MSAQPAPNASTRSRVTLARPCAVQLPNGHTHTPLDATLQALSTQPPTKTTSPLLQSNLSIRSALLASNESQPPPPAGHAQSPLLPTQPLAPAVVRPQREHHLLLDGDTSILLRIRHWLGHNLDDHVSLSRLSIRWRAIYQGAEEAGVDFWETKMRRAGWEPLSSRPGATAFLTLLAILRHRASCTVEVLRPWPAGYSVIAYDSIQPACVDEGEWVRLCSSNGTEDAIWPPPHPYPTPSSTALIPHPLLSDLVVPLYPPPRRLVLTQTTLATSFGPAVAIEDHPSFSQQMACWPARETVEVEFVWGEGRLTGPEGKEALQHGRVRAQIGEKGSGSALTVETLVEEIVAYWRQDLTFDEARTLVHQFPEIDQRGRGERSARGSWNKFLGQTRKRYGRWRFLGNTNILIGFIPCPAHPSTRLTAYLASKDDIKAYQPPPPFPLPQLDLDVQMGGDGDVITPLTGGA